MSRSLFIFLNSIGRSLNHDKQVAATTTHNFFFFHGDQFTRFFDYPKRL